MTGPAIECDHDGSMVEIRTPPHCDTLLLSWCSRCGALRANGETRRPELNALLLEVLRAVPMYEYTIAVRDRDAMCETLTAAQESGTKLAEENRKLRVRLAELEGRCPSP